MDALHEITNDVQGMLLHLATLLPNLVTILTAATSQLKDEGQRGARRGRGPVPDQAPCLCRKPHLPSRMSSASSTRARTSRN
jgi:hypothetical protein